MTRKLINVDRKYLNSKILILMTKFSRKLHRIDGTVLRLQDDNILEQIMHHCNHTDNSELHTIYTELRLEILNSISGNYSDDSMIKFSSVSGKNSSSQNKPLA